MTAAIGRPRKVKRHAAMVNRDAEVATLVASGMSNYAIGQRLGVTARTVYASVARLAKSEPIPTRSRSPKNDESGLPTHAEPPRDQIISTPGPCCPSCSRPITDYQYDCKRRHR